MGDERRERPIPAGLKAALIALALGWIALLLVLSRTHTTRGHQRPQAVLPVYPSAVALSRSSVPDRDWRTVTYAVALDYPSLDVFHYYDERMTDQGWSREGAPDLPEWQVSGGGPSTRSTGSAAPRAFTPSEVRARHALPVLEGGARGGSRKSAGLLAQWFSPDRLMQLDLQLRWEEPEASKGEADEEYHMRVTATIQRSVAPFIELPRKRETPPDKGESPFAR